MPKDSTFSVEALDFVERNWERIWQRINAGGLVQHQIELAAILTEFHNAQEDPHA